MKNKTILNPSGKNTLEVPVVNFPNQKQQTKDKERIKNEAVVNSIGETINKNWITISGIATSEVRTRKKTDVEAMIFFRLKENNKHSLKECVENKCKSCETPVIFRIQETTWEKRPLKELENINWVPKKSFNYIKPQIKKGDNLQLGGYFADTHKPRPSFTAYSYQVL